MKACHFCKKKRQMLIECGICKKFYCGLCGDHHIESKELKEDQVLE